MKKNLFVKYFDKLRGFNAIFNPFYNIGMFNIFNQKYLEG